MGLTRASVLVAYLVLGLLAAASGEARAASAPGNDELAHAQPINTFPATIVGTTVGATIAAGEVESACGSVTADSVWYSLRLPAAHRVAIKIAAAGALDATVDVYHAVRSRLDSVSCEKTDSEGKASFSFVASRNGLYEIRVAALPGSALNTFNLEVFLPRPSVGPPGPPLPAGGISGQVDRIQNINAAYSMTLRSGVSYLINLANETEGACVSGALFPPGTRTFGGEEAEEATGLLDIHCGGYRLFTPGPGQGGRYSLDITPRLTESGGQRFRLQVAPAGPDETAPGITLANHARAHGRLDGNTVRVLRLYRLEVTSHSNLTLKLTAPGSAEFSLQLRNLHGYRFDCQCEGGGPKTLQHQLQPGTYYAVVSERNHTAGNFTLARESRTITSTSISFSSRNAAAGQSLAINVKVTPAESGPVAVEIQRFDPVFGWQYYAEQHTTASAGTASVPFSPPTPGLWRAKANYQGSNTASPSAVGYTYLLAS